MQPIVPGDGELLGLQRLYVSPVLILSVAKKYGIMTVLSETCHLRLFPTKWGPFFDVGARRARRNYELPGLPEGSLQVPHQQCESAYPLGEGSPGLVDA